MGAPASPAAPAAEAALPLRGRLLSDERLARLVEDGSERAFAVIYERYHQRLYRYCRSLLRDGDDAYDALQSTFANALAAVQRGRRDAPLRPWLFRIAHNESISLIRRRESGHGSFGAAEPFARSAEPCAPSAEARADERARLALLVSDLGELSERQRAVLLMRELSGLSRKDIASALGLSVQTVGRALLAARRSLGEFEQGRAMACEQVQRSISINDRKLPLRARAHVRDCAGCAAFAAAIPTRRADLHALAAPLAPIPAAALLAIVRGAACRQGAGGGKALAAGLSGKTAGAALAAKALAGVAIVAVASASATGVAAKLTGGEKTSVSAGPSARAATGQRHPRHSARTGASRALRATALAPARLDVTPQASAGGAAVNATSSAPGASSEPTGTVERAKPAGTAISTQGRPSRSGPVHAAHPPGAGAVHGKPTTATSHARSSGATGAARGVHGSAAAKGERRESAGAAPSNGHADGGQGRTSERPSAGPSGDPKYGRPAEAPNAPSSQPEPSSATGEKQSPPAHEEAGDHGPGGQHGGAGGSSPQTSDG